MKPSILAFAFIAALSARAQSAPFDGDEAAKSFKPYCDSYSKAQEAHSTCSVDAKAWEAFLTPRAMEDINLGGSTAFVAANMCGTALQELYGEAGGSSCIVGTKIDYKPCRDEMAKIQTIVCRPVKDQNGSSSIEYNKEKHALTLILGKDYGKNHWPLSAKELKKISATCAQVCSGL